MDNVQGWWGWLHYCRKFAESISADTDLCIWLVYQFIWDPFWIHGAIMKDAEKESRLSQQSGRVTLDVILQLNVTAAASSFFSNCPQSFALKEDVGFK